MLARSFTCRFVVQRNTAAVVVGTIYSIIGTGLIVFAMGCRPIVLQEEGAAEADHDVKVVCIAMHGATTAAPFVCSTDAPDRLFTCVSLMI